MSIFVTVGTTSFDSLIRLVVTPPLQAIFRSLGYTRMTLQIGRGDFDPLSQTVPDDNEQQLELDVYRYKSGITEDLAKADLVISHAGAGSAMEALAAGKRLLVVVNEELMHNHQTELARELAQQGFCLHTTCSQLPQMLTDSIENLRADAVSTMRSFPQPTTHKFATFIDSVMAFPPNSVSK